MDLLAELRRRLNVPASVVSDEVLTGLLDEATNIVTPWLVADPTPWQANVDGATVSLAVKLYDTTTRGIVGFTPDGEYLTPAGTAGPRLILSVAGELGDAYRAGGVSV